MHFKKLLISVCVDDILFVPSWRIWFLCFFLLLLCVHVCPCSICVFAMCSGCCCSVVCSAGHFRDAVAPVLFFSPDLSKLIMAQQLESPLCWSSGRVTLTLLCFFFFLFLLFFFNNLSMVQRPQFPRDALIPSLCLNLSGKMDEWL